MHLAVFEPARPRIEQQQIYVLDRMDTGIDSRRIQKCRILHLTGVLCHSMTPYRVSVVFSHIHLTKQYKSFIISTDTGKVTTG
jgi:hypothetical protein